MAPTKVKNPKSLPLEGCDKSRGMGLPFFSGWEGKSDGHRGAAVGIPGCASHFLFFLGNWETVRSESEGWRSRRIADRRPLL